MFALVHAAAAEALDAGAIAALSDGEFDALSADAAEALRVCEALWLRVVDGMRERAVHLRHGARDTATYIAGLTGERRGAARRDVVLAEMLGATPLVAAAFDAGTVSKAQAAELVRAGDLPVGVQQGLVAEATRMPVEHLAREVVRARLDYGAEVGEEPEQVTTARSATGFRADVHLDLEGGEFFDLAIDTAIDQLGLSKDLAIEQRRAWGLKHVCRYFVDHLDPPVQTRMGPVGVMAMTTLGVLEARAGGSARLGSGAVIRGDVARRMACDAGITRIITNGKSKSEVLDVGRTTRAVSPAMAKAVIARDQHCRHQGCDAPPWACEIHHTRPWAEGGPTSVKNLELRCWFHHQCIHQEHDHDARARAPDEADAA